MIRQCHVCGRGFVDVDRRKKDDLPPMLCATCRRGGRPLSCLVGGRPREEAERRQIEKEKGLH